MGSIKAMECGVKSIRLIHSKRILLPHREGFDFVIFFLLNFLCRSTQNSLKRREIRYSADVWTCVCTRDSLQFFISSEIRNRGIFENSYRYRILTIEADVKQGRRYFISRFHQ